MKPPDLPPIKQNGSYDPQSLRNFIRECSAENVAPHTMASMLNVSIDRITYLLGDGRNLILNNKNNGADHAAPN